MELKSITSCFAGAKVGKKAQGLSSIKKNTNQLQNRGSLAHQTSPKNVLN
jgi:hypothetical protein